MTIAVGYFAASPNVGIRESMEEGKIKDEN